MDTYNCVNDKQEDLEVSILISRDNMPLVMMKYTKRAGWPWVERDVLALTLPCNYDRSELLKSVSTRDIDDRPLCYSPSSLASTPKSPHFSICPD